MQIQKRVAAELRVALLPLPIIMINAWKGGDQAKGRQPSRDGTIAQTLDQKDERCDKRDDCRQAYCRWYLFPHRAHVELHNAGFGNCFSGHERLVEQKFNRKDEHKNGRDDAADSPIAGPHSSFIWTVGRADLFPVAVG